MARAAKKAKPPARQKNMPKPPKQAKQAKKPPVQPPAVPVPPTPKPKPVYSLPFDRPAKVVAPTVTPTPIAPIRGERVGTLTPRFGWISVAAATEYQLAWSNHSHLTKSRSLLVNQTAATLPPEEALEPGILYYWRVRAGNDSGWGPWSPIQEFGTPEQDVVA